MELKIRNLSISSGGPLVAILNEEDSVKLDLKALDRVKLKKGSKEAVVIIDIAKRSIKKGTISLFDEVINELQAKNNEKVCVSQEPLPQSLQYIKKKLDGGDLSKMEINEIVKDIVLKKLSEVEITYFVVACYINGLTLYESAYLTEAIVENGKKLSLKKYPILDKHSLGGIPGNRTTPIVVSIVAANGFIIPKTSTRSITSVSGTADTVEVFAPVSHPIEKIEEIVKKTNGCMVWGGALELASADDKLIKIEKALSIDPRGIMLASILAKKAAVGATHVVIDMPIGKGSKVVSKKEANILKRKFLQLGKLLGMELKIVMTDGTEPIGNGLGPALEARDILLTLQNKGPEPLKKKALILTSTLLGMVGVKNPYKKALETLESGAAYTKFKDIIKAQGGNPNVRVSDIKIGKFKSDVKAKENCIIKELDNKLLTSIAKSAGAPFDKGAGIYLNVHVKDKVKKGGILYTIYAERKQKLDYTLKLFKKIPIICEPIKNQ